MAIKTDCQDARLDRFLRKIDEALADPRPSITLEEAFARLDALSMVRRSRREGGTYEDPAAI
jgi:hypothetical protein